MVAQSGGTGLSSLREYRRVPIIRLEKGGYWHLNEIWGWWVELSSDVRPGRQWVCYRSIVQSSHCTRVSMVVQGGGIGVSSSREHWRVPIIRLERGGDWHLNERWGW